MSSFYTLIEQLESSHQGIYILAATTRPDWVNPRILGPSRMNKFLFVGYPNAQTQFDILKIHLKKALLSATDLWAIVHDNSCKDLQFTLLHASCPFNTNTVLVVGVFLYYYMGPSHGLLNSLSSMRQVFKL